VLDVGCGAGTGVVSGLVASSGLGSLPEGTAGFGEETAWMKFVDSRVERIFSQLKTNRSRVARAKTSQIRHPAREPDFPVFCDAELRCVAFRGAIRLRY